MAVIVFGNSLPVIGGTLCARSGFSIMVCTDTIQYTFPRDEADLTGSFTQRDIQLSEVFKKPLKYSGLILIHSGLHCF